MLVPKPVLLTLAFVVAQSFVPQTACDRRLPPPTPNDPWANAPITETITTSDGVRLGVQVLLTNVQIPWALAFAPDGRLFFTERPGRVRVVQDGALIAQPALTLTDTVGGGEGGVLGFAFHPAFAQNRFVYLAYTRTLAGGGAVNRVMRYRASNNTLTEGVVLLDNVQAGGGHNGARVRFGPDGKLYVTFGDANVPNYAQTLSVYAGKILRLNDDGSTPVDNPFGSPVWTWGHRHPQGIAWHPQTGDMWATEHGQTGNDELQGRFGRIRDVITGSDGALYFCTSNRDGRTTPVATDDRIARIIPVQ